MNNKNMNNNFSVFCVAGVVVAFLLGGVAGVFYQTQATAGDLAKVQAARKIVQAFTSKVVPSIVAYGQVDKIEEKTITLKNGQETVAIKIGDTSPIYSLSANQSVPTQTRVDFSKIKLGDSLNIAIAVSPDGQFEGTSVIILPISLSTK